ITFHSLEDRIVKNKFKDLATACKCPKDIPICVCGGVKKFEIITKKPIIPIDDELKNNNRAHSSKLRILERILD
ncbi:16S rRNA (cytosine(1402)-N(4))-methyltransferase, partial [Fusobacterium sp.]